MTGFHWTGLEVGALAIFGAAFVAWMVAQVLKRRDEREATVELRRPVGDRFVIAPGWPGPTGPLSVRSAPAGSVRMPLRPAPPPVAPECLDESVVAADAALLIAAAIALCRRDAELRANVALMNDYAARYPMKQRPAPPVDPDEPWQLQQRNNIPVAGLVERGESDNNPGGNR